MKKDISRNVSNYKRAVELIESGKPESALPLLTRILSSDPNNINSLYLLGVCESTSGNLNKAESAFQKVIKQTPKHHQALYGLSLTLEKKGNISEAIKIWKEIISFKPNFDYATRKLQQYNIIFKKTEQKSTPSAKKQPKPDIKKKLWLDKVMPGIDIPGNLTYSKNHAWIKSEGGLEIIGITDFYRFTQNPNWVWVDELPIVGSTVKQGQVVCKITGLVNPSIRKQLYPKGGRSTLSFTEHLKTFRDSSGHFKDPRKRIWISVPSPLSGEVVKINKPMIRKGREESTIRPRQQLNLNFPYSKDSWLFRIQIHNSEHQKLSHLMNSDQYKKYVGSILIGT